MPKDTSTTVTAQNIGSEHIIKPVETLKLSKEPSFGRVFELLGALLIGLVIIAIADKSDPLIGGGYIFIHRLLMEHFAAMETPE